MSVVYSEPVWPVEALKKAVYHHLQALRRPLEQRLPAVVMTEEQYFWLLKQMETPLEKHIPCSQSGQMGDEEVGAKVDEDRQPPQSTSGGPSRILEIPSGGAPHPGVSL